MSQMTYAAPSPVTYAAPSPVTYAAPSPVTYAAPSTMSQMTYAAPQPQMTYAHAAPQMTYAAPSPVTYAAPAAPQQYTIPQQYFEQYDANHDGVIDQQEYTQFQQSPYYHQPAPAMTYTAPQQMTYAAPAPVTYAAPSAYQQFPTSTSMVAYPNYAPAATTAAFAPAGVTKRDAVIEEPAKEE